MTYSTSKYLVLGSLFEEILEILSFFAQNEVVNSPVFEDF